MSGLIVQPSINEIISLNPAKVPPLKPTELTHLDSTTFEDLQMSSRTTASDSLSQAESQVHSDSDDDAFGGVPLAQSLNTDMDLEYASQPAHHRAGTALQAETASLLQGLSPSTRSTQPTTDAELDDGSSNTDADILSDHALSGDCEESSELALVGADGGITNLPSLTNPGSSPLPDLLEWIPMPPNGQLRGSGELLDSSDLAPFSYVRPSMIPPDDIYFSYSQENNTGTSVELGAEARSQRDQFELWSNTSMEDTDFDTLTQRWQLQEPDPEDLQEDFEYNMKAGEFFEFWRGRYEEGYPVPPIGKKALVLEMERNESLFDEITIKDLDRDSCDIQGIDWLKLGAKREDARAIRNRLYRNYRNLRDGRPESAQQPPSLRLSTSGRSLPSCDNSFRFERLLTKHKAKLCQFQLRHLLAAPSRNAVFYATARGVVCANTTLNTQQRVMDFSQKADIRYVGSQTRISTLTAAHDVLAVGGYNGEYAMKSLYSPNDGQYTSGMLTHVTNSITNHVHIFLGRRTGLPQAVFCSNDDYIRTIDCRTNTEVQSHKIPWPSNCSATSPDTRLRLVVGDNVESLILDAETGRRVTELQHHRDFGFACDWSPDGRYMATGNQDGTVQIWDARHWHYPLYEKIPFDKTIGTELGGIRSLHFSPLGEGKPVLLMAEPADVISIVDATTFDTRQRYDFFGEIGGTSFVPDGSAFFVANMDRTFGGLFHFERVTWEESNYDDSYERSRR